MDYRVVVTAETSYTVDINRENDISILKTLEATNNGIRYSKRKAGSN